MIAYNNFEPGNVGVVFYTDIGIPLIGFVLLWLKHRWRYEPSVAENMRGGLTRSALLTHVLPQTDAKSDNKRIPPLPG
jgi:hypothetical protein